MLKEDPLIIQINAFYFILIFNLLVVFILEVVGN